MMMTTSTIYFSYIIVTLITKRKSPFVATVSHIISIISSKRVFKILDFLCYLCIYEACITIEWLIMIL